MTGLPDGSAMWWENRVFAIAWIFSEATSSLKSSSQQMGTNTWHLQVDHSHEMVGRVENLEENLNPNLKQGNQLMAQPLLVFLWPGNHCVAHRIITPNSSVVANIRPKAVSEGSKINCPMITNFNSYTKHVTTIVEAKSQDNNIPLWRLESDAPPYPQQNSSRKSTHFFNPLDLSPNSFYRIKMTLPINRGLERPVIRSPLLVKFTSKPEDEPPYQSIKICASLQTCNQLDDIVVPPYPQQQQIVAYLAFSPATEQTGSVPPNDLNQSEPSVHCECHKRLYGINSTNPVKRGLNEPAVKASISFNLLSRIAGAPPYQNQQLTCGNHLNCIGFELVPPYPQQRQIVAYFNSTNLEYRINSCSDHPSITPTNHESSSSKVSAGTVAPCDGSTPALALEGLTSAPSLREMPCPRKDETCALQVASRSLSRVRHFDACSRPTGLLRGYFCVNIKLTRCTLPKLQ